MIVPYPQPRGVVVSGPRYSIATTGYLGLNVHIRPRASRFPGHNGLKYLHVIRKMASHCEWAIRFHSDDHTRALQLSAYAFNPGGGYGAGVRYATPLVVNQWSHVAVVFDTGNNRIQMSVDGYAARSGERVFEYQGTPIVPVAGPAPVEIYDEFDWGDVAHLTFDDGVVLSD